MGILVTRVNIRSNPNPKQPTQPMWAHLGQPILYKFGHIYDSFPSLVLFELNEYDDHVTLVFVAKTMPLFLSSIFGCLHYIKQRKDALVD